MFPSFFCECSVNKHAWLVYRAADKASEFWNLLKIKQFVPNYISIVYSTEKQFLSCKFCKWYIFIWDSCSEMVEYELWNFGVCESFLLQKWLLLTNLAHLCFLDCWQVEAKSQRLVNLSYIELFESAPVRIKEWSESGRRRKGRLFIYSLCITFSW